MDNFRGLKIQIEIKITVCTELKYCTTPCFEKRNFHMNANAVFDHRQKIISLN